MTASGRRGPSVSSQCGISGAIHAEHMRGAAPDRRGRASVRTEPTQRCADILVVFEGPRRVIWSQRGCQGGPQIGPPSWVPAGLWPTAEQAAEVADHIGRGGRLFVV